MVVFFDRVDTEAAPAAVGPYSQAVNVDFGDSKFLFVSGQLPIDPKTGQLVEGGIKPSASMVFDNIAAILKAAGLGLHSVVRVEIFLKDLNEFPAVNELYREYFKGPIFPARQTVQVVRLPLDAIIEASCIAVR